MRSLPTIGAMPRTQSTDRVRMRLRKWTALIDDGPLLAALQRLLLWRFVTLPTATIGAAGVARAHNGPAALFLR